MILVQQYKSFSELDWEHRSSLESFLEKKLPSLQWLEQEEMKLTKKGKCFIFLFFCDKHNIPIGLSFAHLSEVKQKFLGFWQKFSSFGQQKHLQLKWLIPGLDLSSFFHDDFKVEGQKKLLSLGEKIYKKDKFHLELFKFKEKLPTKDQDSYYFEASSSSLPVIQNLQKDLQLVYDQFPKEVQEGILNLLKHHDELKFSVDFNADGFLSEDHMSLAKKSHVQFIALTYQDRPLFIGEFWPTESESDFFDFHVRPAGGEVDLKTYYYFFLYKLHEYCLEKKNRKALIFLRNSLFEHPLSLGHQIAHHYHLINYSLYKNIGQESLKSMIHENKRTTV